MNKTIIYLLLLLSYSVSCVAQEVPGSNEQQLENLTEHEDAETEDDSFLQTLQRLKKNPINLNDADESDLKELRVLTDLQIANLLSYRRLFGRLISIYELQAIPAWDITTIHRILDYVEIGTATIIKEEFRTRLTNGNHNLLFRAGVVWTDQTDGSGDSSKYLGSSQRLFFRYRYSYKNLLQFGFTADKDAGEQFFKGTQKTGFDFYSLHLFARNIGKIKAIAIGDFTVNFGQGLILWQSQAFKKSAETMGIKRQSSVLRPYNSAGEFFFNRGGGLTIREKSVESTLYVSRRKLGSNIVSPLNASPYISSFQTSGYHRTLLEIDDKNNVVQFSSGINVKHIGKRGQVGINAVYYQFSLPLNKRDEPYNYYALNGSKWHNLSLDYSYTWKNIHVFGETAVDRKSNVASINGLLISADRKIDLSFVIRSIGRAYQAINGNAFTENSIPTDEQGIYTGVSFRPTGSIRVDAYADLYRFSWLKYAADAPGYGKDYLFQLTYTPNKQVEVYTRFKTESKTTNRNDGSALNYLVLIPKQNWRTQLNFKVNSTLSLRTRVELLWYDRFNANEQGFLCFVDCIYKPALKPFSIIGRIAFFETDGYNSRIYSYENDVLYSYSIPAFFDRGCRYYITANYNFKKKISFWMRYGVTINEENLQQFNSRSQKDFKMEIIIAL